MPRRLRLEFEGAIYHVMTRGNARQDIVQHDDDRARLLTDLERSVLRFGWEVLGFVILNNHLHLLLKTPQPNLAKGMQAFLSGYAPSATDSSPARTPAAAHAARRSLASKEKWKTDRLPDAD